MRVLAGCAQMLCLLQHAEVHQRRVAAGNSVCPRASRVHACTHRELRGAGTADATGNQAKRRGMKAVSDMVDDLGWINVSLLMVTFAGGVVFGCFCTVYCFMRFVSTPSWPWLCACLARSGCTDRQPGPPRTSKNAPACTYTHATRMLQESTLGKPVFAKGQDRACI